MLKPGKISFCLLVLLLGILTACRQAETPSARTQAEEAAPLEPTPEVAVEGEATPTPAEVVEAATPVAATVTPLPATDIPAPTSTTAGATPTEVPPAATATPAPPAPAAEPALADAPVVARTTQDRRLGRPGLFLWDQQWFFRAWKDRNLYAGDPAERTGHHRPFVCFAADGCDPQQVAGRLGQ